MYLTIAYLLVMSQYCRCLLAAAFFATRTPPPSAEAWRPSEARRAPATLLARLHGGDPKA
jgi:hypothetical protein